MFSWICLHLATSASSHRVFYKQPTWSDHGDRSYDGSDGSYFLPIFFLNFFRTSSPIFIYRYTLGQHSLNAQGICAIRRAETKTCWVNRVIYLFCTWHLVSKSITVTQRTSQENSLNTSESFSAGSVSKPRLHESRIPSTRRKPSYFWF